MSRLISKLPPEIRELAERRRIEQNPKSKEDLLSIAFHWFITPERAEFWGEIAKENYSIFYEKYGNNEDCTCNSRTVDESGNVVHFEECEKEKDKLDELIEWIGVEIIWHKGCESDLQVINAYETILNKTKEIKYGK
jgi:hypothetical protein